ncbi:MAG: hypothetical protein ACRC7R_08135, partial [Sarcina sp.]
KIICDNKALNKINISEFPSEGKAHVVSTNTEYYKITKAGLVSFTPQSILSNNKITLRALKDLYKAALTITFDPDSMLIKATAINESIGTGIIGSSRKSFEYTFKDTNGITIKTDYIYAYDAGSITRDGSPVDLANSLNDTPFSFGQSIEFYAPAKTYTTVSRSYMAITNVPLNSNEYWKFEDTEEVRITPLGLVLQSGSPLANIKFLKNIIIINNTHNRSSVQIYFDINSKKFLVSHNAFSVGQLSQSGNDDYFIIILKDSLGNQKSIARIKENDRANDFVTALNNHSFEYGDSITMNCLDLNKILINNHPNYENDYHPVVKDEYFTITKLGLVSSIKLLKNEVNFLGYDNFVIVR